MSKKIICQMCGAETKLINEKHLPYRWSDVHRKTKDVHDSASIHYESDMYLCPDCICILLGHAKFKAVIDELKGSE